jgi:hypothetical protein
METTIPTELLELKARFDHWRATRKSKHEPIPDDLRLAALELAQRYSPSLAQKVLKVQVWHLKKRVAAKRAPRAATPKSSKPAFFKLPAEAVLPEAAALSPSNGGYRLQIERPDGARLTITIPPFDLASIQRLCADFLRG